jgi:NADH dehydrogenase FAD-containing subunit
VTFVVAGGGFSGVETIGAINDFLATLRPIIEESRPNRYP